MNQWDIAWDTQYCPGRILVRNLKSSPRKSPQILYFQSLLTTLLPTHLQNPLPYEFLLLPLGWVPRITEEPIRFRNQNPLQRPIEPVEPAPSTNRLMATHQTFSYLGLGLTRQIQLLMKTASIASRFMDPSPEYQTSQTIGFERSTKGRGRARKVK